MRPEYWEGLAYGMDAAGFWSWRGRYDNTKVKDGVGWRIEVAYAHHQKSVSGTNAFPDYGEFKRMLDLLSDVSRGRPFQ